MKNSHKKLTTSVLMSLFCLSPVFAGESQAPAEGEISSLDNSCRGGELESCIRLGEYYQSQNKSFSSDSEHFKKAEHYLNLACSGKNAEGCRKLIELYEVCLSNAEKDSLVQPINLQLCGYGEHEYCLRAAYFYELVFFHNTEWGTKNINLAVDNEGIAYELAEKYYLLAAKKGSRYAYAGLSDMFSNTSLAGLFPDKALRYAVAACKVDKSSCYNLAVIYELGTGTERSSVKALRHGIEACGAQNGFACSLVSVFYDRGIGTKKNSAKAEVYRKKACENDLGFGCSEFEPVYQASYSRNADYSWQQGKYLFSIACGADYGYGCYHLAKTAENDVFSPDPQKAEKYYRKACELKIQEACDALTGKAKEQ